MGEKASDTTTIAAGNAPMAPPGFQPASTLLKSTSTVTPGTLRNASGGQPPLPKESPQSTEASTAPTTTIDTPPAPAKVKPINRPIASKNAIVYNAVQRRNPVLGAIKNVGIEIGDITADYQVGTHNGVLFLSLKYHRLHPEYIHQRIEKMKNSYNFRVLLVLCDINEHQQTLREISKIAIINNLTTFIAWSNEEVAQYLTTFKIYEFKGDGSLKERIHQSYHEQLQHVLTSGKKVNKTDADNLASQFGSFSNISKQSAKMLSTVKGLGATKVTSLVDAFTKPFLVGGLKKGSGSAGEISTSTTLRVDGPGAAEVEVVGSPEWPEDEVDEEGLAGDGVGRGRERVRSRSVEADQEREGQPEKQGGEALWIDPLDEDDSDGEEESGPRKKARVEV